MSQPTQSSAPITLEIDHVTIAGRELEPLRETFAALGLDTDYGGSHANGITHMALLGFVDGSYIELISTLEPDPADAGNWGQQITGDGGPCAWAVRTGDVAAEAARVADLGVPVKGPIYLSRHRPDQALVEWEMAYLGDQGPGATLPFIIKDITPRDMRVRPSAGVVDGLLSGAANVVLGVEELEATTDLFRRVYHWPAPQIKEDAQFGARLAYFKDTPVILAAPLSGHPWLSERLARFGQSPCAFLIGASDFEEAWGRFGLVQARPWFGRQLAWFDPDKLGGYRLGVVA